MFSAKDRSPIAVSAQARFWRQTNFAVLGLAVVAFTLPKNLRAEEPPLRSVEEIAELASKSVVVITQMGREGQREGVGSGFVIDPSGLIATNLHVIGEGRAIGVRTADGKTHEVEAIHASDRIQDLAILKISPTEIPSLPLGNDQDLRPGATVVAVGNPHGLAHSVVSGVVSAKREVDGRPMIQIAIPIEPGNSGGPLLDLRGRVYGLLTMKSLVTENLGFAVPTEALKPLLAKPNPVPMNRWLVLGSIDQKEWQPLFGANWRQRAGRLLVDGVGTSFGGRSLCLSQRELPGETFEVAVQVKLDDESGAAGLVFCADGGEKHYGFYPSGGRLRLSRFEGPDINSWTVLQEVGSDGYRPKEWNLLKVHFDPEGARCYVNGSLVIETKDRSLVGGKVGLAKFRNTRAEFKQFELAEKILTSSPSQQTIGYVDALLQRGHEGKDVAPPEDAEGTVTALRDRADEMERQVALLRRTAKEIQQRQLLETLGKLLDAPEEKIDLLRAALLIAKLDHEEVDVDFYIRKVDQIAADIRRGLDGDADKDAKLAALEQHLFDELGYHGSRADYYNRANSYLSDTIEDREGLPITLSVLYMELAARLGVEIAGIGLPGHFVVRPKSDNPDESMIDVFERGDRVTRVEAERRVQEATGQPLQEDQLVPMTKRAILARMLQNLLGVTQQQGDTTAMLRYLGAILVVTPENAQVRLMRGIMLAQANRHDDALKDLDWLLEHQPEGIDVERVLQFRSMISRR